MAGRMNKLVKDGGIIILRPLEPFPQRQADAILARGIIGVGHAVLQNRRLWHLRHNFLRLGYDIFLHRLGADFQSVALADIEDVVKAKQIFFFCSPDSLSSVVVCFQKTTGHAFSPLRTLPPSWDT